MPPTATPATEAHAGASARRGLVYLTGSRVFFLLSRLLYFFALPRLLASPSEYGNFNVVVGLLFVVVTVFLNGTYQAVSKLTSEDPQEADAVRTAALASRLWICLLFAGALAALAGPLSRLFGDAALAPLIRWGSLAVIPYGLFAVFLGYANGTGRFGRQAGLEVWVAASKAGLVLALAAWAGSALAALAGFTLAQASGVVLALPLLGLRPWRGGYPLRRLLHYEIALMGFSMIAALALRGDLFLLKALLPPARAGEQTGLYAAAQIFAQVPAALTISVSLVILPLVSGALARGEKEAAREYVRQGLLLALLVLLASSVVFSANASLLIALIYPPAYQAAAPALEILVFGGAAYALFLIPTTVLTASGRPRTSLLLALAYLTAICALGLALIPGRALVGAAWTHALGSASALALALAALWWRLGAGLPLFRTLGALAAALAAYQALGPYHGPLPSGALPLASLLAGRAAAQGAIFIGLLFLTRTVRPAELRRLWRARREVDAGGIGT